MDNLQQGIDALKAGKRDEARNFLAAAVKENPDDEFTWQWLYNASNTDKERYKCLQQILRINPQNEKASQLLKQLSGFEIPSSPVATPIPTTPPIQPKKKSNTLLFSLIALVFGLAIICCISSLSNATKELEAKYVIKGSASGAMITYMNSQGGMEQVTQGLPFEKTMSVNPGTALSLVAQNQGAGTIICEIWINGAQKKTSTTTTQYGVVTCTDFATP